MFICLFRVIQNAHVKECLRTSHTTECNHTEQRMYQRLGTSFCVDTCLQLQLSKYNTRNTSTSLQASLQNLQERRLHGNLCHSLTVFVEKKIFLNSGLNLPGISLYLLTLSIPASMVEESGPHKSQRVFTESLLALSLSYNKPGSYTETHKAEISQLSTEVRVQAKKLKPIVVQQ